MNIHVEAEVSESGEKVGQMVRKWENGMDDGWGMACGWAWEANLKRESKEIGLSFATTLPTCSRYGKRHMISHPGKI